MLSGFGFSGGITADTLYVQNRQQSFSWLYTRSSSAALSGSPFATCKNCSSSSREFRFSPTTSIPLMRSGSGEFSTCDAQIHVARAVARSESDIELRSCKSLLRQRPPARLLSFQLPINRRNAPDRPASKRLCRSLGFARSVPSRSIRHACGLRHGCQTPHDRGTIHLLRSGDFHLPLAILLPLFDLHPNRAGLLIAIRPHLRLRAAAVAIAGHESFFEHPQEVVQDRPTAGLPPGSASRIPTFRGAAPR